MTATSRRCLSWAAACAAVGMLVLSGIPMLFGSPRPLIQITWRDVGPAERHALERALQLAAPTPLGGAVWVYEAIDTSTEALRAIVTHQSVADTEGINRPTLTFASALSPRRGGLLGSAPAWAAGVAKLFCRRPLRCRRRCVHASSRIARARASRVSFTPSSRVGSVACESGGSAQRVVVAGSRLDAARCADGFCGSHGALPNRLWHSGTCLRGDGTRESCAIGFVRRGRRRGGLRSDGALDRHLPRCAPGLGYVAECLRCPVYRWRLYASQLRLSTGVRS